VNYYNDSRVRAGDSPNNEADDHERYYQTSQVYRRAYDKARAGDSPADKEREHQSNRDTMIRSANDLRNLVAWLEVNPEQREIDVLKDIAQTIQGIADKLHRNTIGQD
jgi:transposase